MDLLHAVLIFTIGCIVGLINVLAGGGSFLTLAFLIAIGLPPNIANGTNRVGILLQNIFASTKFYKLNILKLKFALIVSAPAIIGAILGSYIAIHIPNEILKKTIAIFMVLISLVTIYNPNKFSKNRNYSSKKWVFILVSFFLIGIYGGFIQAGVGFFIIAASLWGGFNMVEANAIKVFIITLYTIIVLPLFIFSHQVNFLIGLLLGAGSIVGAKMAISLSVKKGDKFIRYVVLALLLVFALKLLIIG
ncbi:sulfite exporter TauE/SafE family protein [Hippea maritima]|uniref:Probable membrane transporter protein n=1 Tax=Hippea maritima (strain ATCC 700847 / DSM 10411 / MH2) TaxID=760142 RepID=F2LV02_HIPMA|nr:sulfite exporter TauE/SafE family protein [Hippea maritima]AEA33586.1 protein of unknown function DUF81 [Hippea maritima DSM 10411]